MSLMSKQAFTGQTAIACPAVLAAAVNVQFQLSLFKMCIFSDILPITFSHTEKMNG